jgi:hypothetical protein
MSFRILNQQRKAILCISHFHFFSTVISSTNQTNETDAYLPLLWWIGLGILAGELRAAKFPGSDYEPARTSRTGRTGPGSIGIRWRSRRAWRPRSPSPPPPTRPSSPGWVPRISLSRFCVDRRPSGLACPLGTRDSTQWTPPASSSSSSV